MGPLTDFFFQGIKLPHVQKIGLELELFLFHKESLKRVTYEDSPGLPDVLTHFIHSGWNPTHEKGFLLGAMKSGATLTLEPGGQLEFSGSPHLNLHEVFEELKGYLSDLAEITHTLNMVPLSLGLDPISSQVPFIPKERYAHMASYWRTHNPISLEMMLKTASIQVNFDYCSEEDMALKTSTAATLQPLVSALFGNSPLKERYPSGYLSYRNHIWAQMESSRTGTPPFMLSPSFTFQNYVDYLLDVPMFFIPDGDGFLDAQGQSFRKHYGQTKSPTDIPKAAWVYHMSTVFPDIRLKQVIEIRAIDALPYDEIMAPAALWTGLLYHPSILKKAAALASTITLEDWMHLHGSTPQYGIETLLRGKPISGLTRNMIDLAIEGLTLRNKLSLSGQNEATYLIPTKERLAHKDPIRQSLSKTLLSNWATLSEEKAQNIFLETDPSVSPLLPR